jgi:hypothetical protein
VALTKITGQVINDSTGLVVGVTTVGGGLSATDGFFSGIVTAVGDASFSGNVSVGGTLTYEDVTNIDAVGLVTARNGIVVGSGITLSKDGDIFFTGIMTGNGSGLTGVANTDVIFPDKISLGDGTQTDGDQINIGIGSDLRMYHASNVSYMDVTAGGFALRGTGNDNVLYYTSNSDVEIYHDGSKKFETNSSGVTITGTLAATAVTGDGSGLTGVGVTVAEGGNEATYESGGKNYMTHTFLTSGVFRTSKAMTVDFLLVGGGGGSAGAEGASGASGGGGGGGVVEGSGFSLSAGTYVVTVGAGGASSNTTTVGGTGGDTTFASVTAKGGGGGADYASDGGAGGSGGGGGEPGNAGGATNQSSQNGGISNITQYGFAGGTGGEYTANPTGGGGGGGAGGAGATPTSTDHGNSVGGAAGAGRANSITGSSTLYGRGGIGGGSGYLNAEPGLNGRGDGATGATAGSGSEGAGAVGGTGIVIIKYEI